MKGTNRKRALLISSSVILLCMTVIVGMTWALFTDTQTVTNHLVAGDLNITLKRVGLTKTTLDENGYLTTVTYSEKEATEDFTNTTSKNKNVFGLTTNVDGEVTEKIVPGSEFISTMMIANNSDAAFKYWIGITFDDENVQKSLAQQLIITVYTDKNGDGTIDMDATDGTTEGDVRDITKNSLEVGSDRNPIGVLDIKDHTSETFVVSVKFDDKNYSYVDGVLTSENDGAKLQNVKFDLVVYAVQETTAP